MTATTATIKDELSRLPAGRACCRRAELSVLLCFGDGLHLTGRRVVIEAELDSGLAARRLRREIGELYGQPARVRILPSDGLRDGPRYVVWVERDGAVLARCTGLIDRAGRPVRGLPPEVVSGGSCDAAAAWRGAFLAQGSLSEPRGSAVLQVDAPGPEAALALVGAARRLVVRICVTCWLCDFSISWASARSRGSCEESIIVWVETSAMSWWAIIWSRNCTSNGRLLSKLPIEPLPIEPLPIEPPSMLIPRMEPVVWALPSARPIMDDIPDEVPPVLAAVGPWSASVAANAAVPAVTVSAAVTLPAMSQRRPFIL